MVKENVVVGQVLEQKALPIEHCPACGRTHRSRHTAPPLNVAPFEWRLTNDGRATAKMSAATARVVFPPARRGEVGGGGGGIVMRYLYASRKRRKVCD